MRGEFLSYISICAPECAFKLPTGFFVTRLTRSWWEIPCPIEQSCKVRGSSWREGGVWGSHWLFHTMTYWNRSVRVSSCLITSLRVSTPSLFDYSTNLTRGFGDSATCVVGNQLVWPWGLEWITGHIWLIRITKTCNTKTLQCVL